MLINYVRHLPHNMTITKKWIGVVGLEVHAQINSVSKLFSGAGTAYAELTNSQVSLFDAAIPGTLPVLNKKCVEQAVLTALALNCTVHPTSWFDRKHYFYSDLPAGYQITQQRYPFATNGELEFQICTPANKFKSYTKKSKIKQIQLEQDSGKSLHDATADISFIDLNRAGIPLLELVFEPDLNNGEEAASLVKELILILQKLNTCSCKIEEGGFRVDANVSVRSADTDVLGVRSEVKNIASVNGVKKAVDFELNRQVSILNSGGQVINETRAWNGDRDCTVPMRDKEVEQDYRFMPEPNLPPLKLSFSDERDECALINVPLIGNKLPELPAQTRQQLISKYGLSTVNALRLMDVSLIFHYFCDLVADGKKRDPVKLCNVLLIEILHCLHTTNVDPQHCNVPSLYIGEVIDLIWTEKINKVIFKKILSKLLTGCIESPLTIVENNNWWQNNDEIEIHKLCIGAINANSDKNFKKKFRSKEKYIQAILDHVIEIDETVNVVLTKQVITELVSTKKEGQ